MGSMRDLLGALASGKPVTDAWEEAGYASPDEAASALVSLAESLHNDRKAHNTSNEIRSSVHQGKIKEGSGPVIVHTDGAARGNPGPASAAAVAYLESGDMLTTRSMALGEATNNEAEYRALILGLELARDLGARKVTMKLDSELVVKQMNGEYRIKKPHLAALAREVASMKSQFDQVIFEHVRREGNVEADRIANEVLDGKDGSD